MCKSKKGTDVVASQQSSKRSSDGYRSSQGSFFDPSASNNVTTANYTTTDSRVKDSWQSSISSRTSLPSLRESLPENVQVYNFSEICSATNNFLAKKFSSSSSSASWRCVIRCNEVMVFQRKLRRPIHADELHEWLSLIYKSHHTSLIQLRGASFSGIYVYLVYDYVHGANLTDCLRNPRNPNFCVLSNWISRMQIATDLAHGLDYIHHCTGLSSSFVHNRIKSSSIIVTEPSLNAKICHFGTAMLCGEIANGDGAEELNSGVLLFEGTRGYMSPEFQSTGVPTQKSDIFSLGVVILELLSGEEPLKYILDSGGGGYRRVSVIETAREAARGSGGRLRSWIDRRLKDSFPVEVAEKMVRLALDCVEEYPGERPDMERVAGRISKLYLESKFWAEKLCVPVTDFSVSLAPR
ncbi:Non-specific protein-tyrosine kinase [Bertholletia excelsa]